MPPRKLSQAKQPALKPKQAPPPSSKHKPQPPQPASKHKPQPPQPALKPQPPQPASKHKLQKNKDASRPRARAALGSAHSVTKAKEADSIPSSHNPENTRQAANTFHKKSSDVLLDPSSKTSKLKRSRANQQTHSKRSLSTTPASHSTPESLGRDSSTQLENSGGSEGVNSDSPLNDSVDSEDLSSNPLHPSFLSPNVSKKELISRLKAVHNKLRKIPLTAQGPQAAQVRRVEGLQEIAATLVEEWILDHKDKDVRVLNVCCIVSILSLYAPDVPYSMEEVKAIFEAIVSQIRGISVATRGSAVGERYFYILESLATSESSAILAELVERRVDGAIEVFDDFLEALISSIRPSEQHPPEIGQYMSDIILSYLKCCAVIPTSTMDLLLNPLLPANKKENPAAFDVVDRVLKKGMNYLQDAVCKFVNDILSGNPTVRKGTDLADHIYPLIYELHRVHSSYLIQIFPRLGSELQSEDDIARFKIVQLLGRLYASAHVQPCDDYGKTCNKNLKEFLSRCVDKSVEIRKEMVKTCRDIFVRKEYLREIVEGKLVERLRDPDVEVRKLALKEMMKIAETDTGLEALSKDTLQQMLDRVRDKKPPIRNLAIEGMCKLYAKHISVRLSPLGESLEASSVTAETWVKLANVPKILIEFWKLHQDPESKDLAMKMLEEVIIPPSLTARQRAHALVCFHKSLGPNERHAWSKILSRKQKGHIALLRFVQKRLDGGGQEQNFLTDVKEILELWEPNERKMQVLQTLHSCKDKTVLKLIRQLAVAEACDNPERDTDTCNMSTSITSVEDKQAQVADKHGGRVNLHRELVQRLGSHTAVGEFATRVLRRWCAIGFGVETVKVLLEHICVCESEERAPVTELLVALAEHMPFVFANREQELQAWLSEAKATEVQPGLLVLTFVAKELAKSVDITSLASLACQVALTNAMSDVCVSAGKALVNLYAHPSAEIDAAHGVHFQLEKCLKYIADKLKLNPTKAKKCQSKENMFLLFAELTSHPFVAKHPLSSQVSMCACDLVLDPAEILDGEPTGSSSAETVLAALRAWTHALVNSMIHCSKPQGEADEDLEQEQKLLTSSLYGLISTRGRELRGVAMPQHAVAAATKEASVCCLECMRVPSMRMLVSCRMWHELGWAMYDGQPQVRDAFFDKLCSLSVNLELDLRGVSYLCLAGALVDQPVSCGTNTQSFAHAARVALTKTLNKFKNVMVQMHMEKHDLHREATISLMPEHILPYVLHLLAHSRNFPDGDDDHDRIVDLEKCLKLVISVLVDGMEGHGENLAFLMRMLETITSSYEDATCPSGSAESDRLAFVTGLAYKILRGHMSESIEQHPGSVFLPSSLFRYTLDPPTYRSHETSFTEGPGKNRRRGGTKRKVATEQTLQQEKYECQDDMPTPKKNRVPGKKAKLQDLNKAKGSRKNKSSQKSTDDPIKRPRRSTADYEGDKLRKCTDDGDEEGVEEEELEEI